MATLSQIIPKITFLVLVFHLGTSYASLACNECPPNNPPPVVKPQPPPVVYHPPPTPVVKPPPVYNPPTIPNPPATTCPTYRPACPIAVVEVEACINVLNLLNVGIGIGIGTDAKAVCCPVLSRLSDWEAAECLCTAVKAKVSLNVDLVFPKCRRVCEACGKPVPPCFQCSA